MYDYGCGCFGKTIAVVVSGFDYIGRTIAVVVCTMIDDGCSCSGKTVALVVSTMIVCLFGRTIVALLAFLGDVGGAFVHSTRTWYYSTYSRLAEAPPCVPSEDAARSLVQVS